MNIPKAIEKLKLVDTLLIRCIQQPERDAIQLGIEALKREESWRRLHPHLAIQPLSGETED